MSETRNFDAAQHSMDRVRPKCLAAIATMRNFLDDAERSVMSEDAAPEEMIDRTLHRMAWGFANASSDLSTAISALEDARKITAFEHETKAREA